MGGGAAQYVPARRIAIVSASVGAGHDGAAGELARRLREAGFLVDCHDFLDLLGGRAGRALRGTYAAELQIAPNSWGWLIGQLERRDWLAAAIRALFARGAAAPLDGGDERRPATSRSRPSSSPPTRWPARRWAGCGADRPAGRPGGHLPHRPVRAPALGGRRRRPAPGPARGGRGSTARRLSGGFVEVCRPAVRPAFHPTTDPDEPARDPGAVRAARARDPIALVVAGSWGVGEVAEAAADLAATGLATPVTVCGRNERLRERLIRSGTGVRARLGRRHARADPGQRRRGAERRRADLAGGDGRRGTGPHLPLPARARRDQRAGAGRGRPGHLGTGAGRPRRGAGRHPRAASWASGSWPPQASCSTRRARSPRSRRWPARTGRACRSLRRDRARHTSGSAAGSAAASPG